VSRRIAEAVDPIAQMIDQKLSESGFGHWEEQFGLWHGRPKHQAAAEGVRILYNRGILPHPGDPAPASFCMWGHFGETGLFTCSK
jgi:hypothetical protein